MTTPDFGDDTAAAIPHTPEIDALAAAVRAAITGHGTPAIDPVEAVRILRERMDAGDRPALFAMFELVMLRDELKRQRRRPRKAAKR